MNKTKPESDLSLAFNAILFILILAAVVIVVPLLFAQEADAAGYGSGDNGCHGANQASCRPDPQPSHGQDCQPHGNNPDGNDDHCASAAPIVAPSTTPDPTGSLIPPATGTPGPTGFEPPAAVGTPPSTSTATTPAVTRTDRGWLVALVFIIAAVCGALLTPRRVRRGHR